MRLDKYLKVSRIIKRRSLANEACANSKVLVNGKVAKPSVKVDVGDVIELRLGEKVSRYEVLDLSEHTLKKDANRMYRELS